MAKYTVVCRGKISISTKDSCPNQITSKVKWSALNHIFALVENASNRQTKDLERVQKQRARVWGSHPSGKNFTPALRFTRLVILYPYLLSTKSIRELGTRLRALQREGFLEKTHDYAGAYCPAVYFVCIYLVIRSYWEWRHFKLLRQPRGAFWVRVSDVLTIPACTWEKITII